MRRCLLALALPASALVASACAAPSEDEIGASDQAHTARSYVQESSPYFWAAQSYEEFRTNGAQLGGPFTAPPLEGGSALEQRLQAWLDRIDAIVRPEVLRQTGTPLPAPRPVAKIIHSAATYNAWVSGTLACPGMPLGGTPSAPPAAGSSAYLDLGSVQPATGYSCARPADWTPSGFATFWNAAKPACALRPATGGGWDVGSTTCAVEPGATPAADAMTVATSPFIQFSTDLLMELDENTVALVAAHELGHFYLAHGTSVGRSKYNYWYALGGQQQQVAPTRATNAAELEAAYKEVASPAASAPLAFGKRYSARLRPLLLTGIAPLLQERLEPDFACAAARDALGPWAGDVLGGAPPPESRASFEAFEKKLAACAPELALGEAGARALSAGQVLFAAGRSRPGPKVKPTLRLGDTLAGFLDRLDVKARELDAKAARLLQRARQNGLGLYTTEQSADDFAVELATKLGLSPEEILGAWASFMEASDRRWSVGFTPEGYEAAMKAAGEETARSCKALLAADFTTTDASGRRAPVTMSMGQLDEPHHASCYRLYNMWRELRAHHAAPGPRQPALAPAWSELQAEAARLSRTAPDAQPAATPAP